MARCTLCESEAHDSLTCGKRMGCAKCGAPKTHNANGCTENTYAPYDRQPCDQCLSLEHEAKNCGDLIGGVCSVCGHSDHKKSRKKECPLVNAIQLNQLSDDIIDRFTPEYRAIAIGKIREQNASKQANPTSAPKGSPSNSQTSSAALRPKGGIQTLSGPSKGGSSAAGGAKTTDEDSKTAQLQRWKLAEKKLPQKPKSDGTGPHGNDIKANFFEVAVTPTVTLWKYSITIEPKEPNEPKEGEPRKGGAMKTEELSKKKRKIKRETKEFLINHYLTSANPPSHTNWTSDYDSIIVSVKPLYSDQSKLGRAIPQPHGNEPPQKHGKPSTKSRSMLVTTINEVGRINMSHLIDHVKGKKRMESPDDLLKVLNIISWKNITGPNSKIGRVGNRIYPESQNKKSEESKMRRPPEQYFLRDGFFSSMRPGDGSILLNVNTVTTAFLSPINLQEWMELAWNNHRPSLKAFNLLLKDIRVTLDLHNSSRTWVICGMSPREVGETTFEKDGKYVKVSDYLKREYGAAYKATPKDLGAFCINVGSQSRKIWYPANFLTILDWQVAKESVQKASGKDMVKVATRTPQVNKRMILDEGLKVLGIKPLLPFYSIFGLKPSSNMVTVKAGMLNAPKLHYAKDDKVEMQPKITNGGWNLSAQSGFLEPRVARRILVLPLTQELFVARGNNRKNLRPAVQELEAGLRRYGMTRQQSTPIIYAPFETTSGFIQGRSNRPEDREKWTQKLDKKFSSFKPIADGDFLLVILPTKDITMYQEVKRWVDCIIGIPSICVTAEKLLRNVTDLATRANICMKVNFKLKGVSHRIAAGINDQHATGAKPGTMIVGADVTHPGKGLKDCPSMAAIVATNNERSSHYLGSARLQKGRQEHISDLEGMIEERVVAWFKSSEFNADGKLNTTLNRLPKCILFYRDGVSESQYGMILDEEREQIMRGCSNALAFLKKPAKGLVSIPKTTSWDPKLTLVVVTKRHHARFYPILEAPDVNLLPGTMVDCNVVTPLIWSFYLQSHYSGLGTARSALYVVLYDDCRYTAYDLQKITNNICYTSARATKAVSVCTPARYADILCDRLRCYMKPALEGKYTVEPTKSSNPGKSSSSSAPTKSSKVTRPAQATKEAEDEELKPRYVEDYEADSNIWMPSLRTDGRKNPWHERLDDSMFYL